MWAAAFAVLLLLPAALAAAPGFVTLDPFGDAFIRSLEANAADVVRRCAENRP